MNKRNSIILAFVFLLLFACSKYPKGVLDSEDMVDLLYDIQIAQAVYKNNPSPFSNPSDKDALINDVLKRRGITQAELDSSLVWYSDNPELYVKVHDKVVTRLTEKRDGYDKIIRQTELSSRRSDLPVPRYFYLTDTDPLFRFSLDSTQVEKIGSDLYFTLKTLGAHSDIAMHGQVAFEFPDTTLYVNREMKNNSTYKFERPPHPLGLVRISGYVKSEIKNPQSNILLYEMKVENKE